MFDWLTPGFTLEILSCLVAVVVSVAVFVSNRRTNEVVQGADIAGLKRRVDDHGTRIERHGERLAVLEEVAKHAPTARDLADLRGAIGRLSENVARAEGVQSQLARAVDLQQQHLLSVPS